MVEGAPIGDSANISPSKIPSGQDITSQDQNDQTFKNLVQDTKVTNNSKPSPMSAASGAQGSMQMGKPTPENVLANMQVLMSQMNHLGAALQTPNLQLTSRTRRLLDAKLKRSKEHIQYVSSKVNVGDEGNQGGGSQKQNRESVAKAAAQGKDENSSAIEKFVGYITDGQSQLESAMHNVSHMKMDPNNPGMALEQIFGMQVKLYRAQVEIEFSSAVLQKAIDDLKTIMSVQL